MLKPHLRGAARRAHGSSAERRRKIGAPAEAQRSGFGGERRSSVATELFGHSRKRRMRSLRRRNRVKRTVAKWFAQSTSEWPKTLLRGFKGPQPLDTPFSPIFRRATKDGATGGRQLPSAAGKNAKQNDYATGGRQLPSAARKNEKEISL